MKKITLLLAMMLVSTFTFAQYCTGGPTSTVDSNVQQVDLIGATTNISHTGCPGVLGLEDLTAQSADLVAGTSYTLNVTFGTCGGNYGGAGEVWIDYNQNFTFEAGESIGQSAGTPGTAPWDVAVPFTFTPPVTAINGATRMRVMQRESGSNPLDPCGTYSWGSVMDFTINISGGTAPPSCVVPNTLTATAITATQATLGWTSADTLFDVEVVASGAAATGTATDVGVANPFTKMGLTAATAYDYYVRTDCGGGSTSTWAGPFTFSTAIAGPVGVTCPGSDNANAFTEEFDAQGGWTGNIAATETNGSWVFPKTGTTSSASTGPSAPHSGGNYMYYEASGSTVAVASAVSPAIDLTPATDGAELSFFLHAYGSGIGNFEVGVGTAAAGPFTNVFSWSGQIQTSNADAWTPVGVNLDAYIGQTIYLEFKHTGINDFNGDLAIDLVNIATCGNFCETPTALTGTAITSTQADLGWTSTDTLFDVEVVASGAAATGTPTNGGVANPFTKTGLTANTAYDFYVRADCGGGSTSTWAGPFTFTTTCGVMTTPSLEDFATYPSPGNCWAEGNDTDIATGPNGTDGNWGSGDFVNDAAHANGLAARFNLWNTGDQDWLVTPTFDLSAGGMAMQVEVAISTFTGTNASAMGTDDEVQVLISSDNGATWVNLETFNAGNAPSLAGDKKTYDLSAYTSATTKFAFWANEGTVDDAEDYYFYVDNFRVDTFAVLTVQELQQLEGFSFYPNPVNNMLNVSAQSNIERLQIVNMLGQVVKTAQPNMQSYQLDMSSLATGVYFVKATVNNVQGTFRIVKQ